MLGLRGVCAGAGTSSGMRGCWVFGVGAGAGSSGSARVLGLRGVGAGAGTSPGPCGCCAGRGRVGAVFYL